MVMTETLDRLLTAEEAGKFLGLKTGTVRRMTYTKELPVVRPTGKRAEKASARQAREGGNR
jgi:excisionase family DNA binding protein